MKRFYPSILRSAAIIVGLWLLLELSSRLFAEILWFEEVGYLSVFLVHRLSQYGLWFLATLVSGLFIGGNLRLANRWQWRKPPKDEWYDPYDPGVAVATQPKLLFGRIVKNRDPLPVRRDRDRRNFSPRLKLPWLLIAAIAGAIGISSILINQTDIALSVWQTSYRLPQITTTLRPPLDVFNVTNVTGFIISYLRQLGIVVVIVALLLWKPQISLRAIAIFISVIFGLIAAGNWIDLSTLL